MNRGHHPPCYGGGSHSRSDDPVERLRQGVRTIAAIPAGRRPGLVIVCNQTCLPERRYPEQLDYHVGVTMDILERIPNNQVKRLFRTASIVLYTSNLEPFGFATFGGDAERHARGGSARSRAPSSLSSTALRAIFTGDMRGRSATPSCSCWPTLRFASRSGATHTSTARQLGSVRWRVGEADRASRRRQAYDKDD
jgi:hypothetical protein